MKNYYQHKFKLEPKLIPFLQLNYLKTSQITTLDFRKKKLFIGNVKKEFCGFSFSDTINWGYDFLTQTLNFYDDDILLAKFKIISKKYYFTKWFNESKEKPIRLRASILTLELVKME